MRKEETRILTQLDHHRAWTVAEAQSQLSEILRLAAEEGPQHIDADRSFVVVPAETWYAHEQPQRLPQLQGRQPVGKWLLENMPRGIDLELPSRREPERPIPFLNQENE